MALENETIISFQNVTKQYPNGVLGLKDLNIDIKKGEFVIVVGLSGAGKSTMLAPSIDCTRSRVARF